MTTEGLQASEAGFGVFAYYTQASNFSAWGGRANTDFLKDMGTGKEANFMFNEKVTYNTSGEAGLITKWSYSPVKYWPNDFSTTDVDDQDADGNDHPANGSEAGGKLTFFAYAPYVDFGTTAPQGLGATDGTASGIIAINGATTLAGAQAATTEPVLTYVLSADNTKFVDLLWGTNGGSSLNVNGETSASTTGNKSETTDNYKKTVLDGYTVNDNLTKQKTNGTVNFAFKHALAKVGGSMENTVGATQDHGLMVILDVDDMKGAEKGGTYNNDETKVTITSIEISAKSRVNDTPEYFGNSSSDGKIQGRLNLATGQWDLMTTISTTDDNKTSDASKAVTTTHKVYSPAASGTHDAEIADNLAEPASSIPGAGTAAGWDKLPAGVQTKAKNVYKGETNPLVFIPGTKPELTITVDYTVRTKDEKLAGAYTEVKQKITKTVAFTEAVELNKQYSLLIHLGLTGIKFTATVSDWQVAGDTNGNGVIGEGESPVQLETWNPINVGAYTLTATVGETEVSAAANQSVTFSNPQVKYYDYSTGAFTTANVALGDVTASSDNTAASVSTFTTDGKVTFTAANQTTRKIVANITLSYDKTPYTSSKKPESLVVTLTQKAGALSVAPKTGSENTFAASEVASAAKDVTFTVKDAATANVDLTSATNSVTITDENSTGWTIVKKNGEFVVTVPKSASAGTYKFKIKVNDADEVEAVITINS